MPHVVLAGGINMQALASALNGNVIRDPPGGMIVRLEESFLNATGSSLLIRVTVVEGIPRSFYIIVTRKQAGVTIRLDHLTDPEKTNGVKTALALVAVKAMQIDRELSVVKTNISDYLDTAMHMLTANV
jgi:hypothetical protein